MAVLGPIRSAIFVTLRRLLVPALLLMAIPAARVDASCGDYLHVGRHVVLMDAGLAEMSLAANEKQSPVRPCTGPRCSRQSAPLTTPPVIVSITPIKVAVSPWADHGGATGGHTFSSPEWLVIPIHRTLHIFRPPRVC